MAIGKSLVWPLIGCSLLLLSILFLICLPSVVPPLCSIVSKEEAVAAVTRCHCSFEAEAGGTVSDDQDSDVQLGPSEGDLIWLKSQLQFNQLPDAPHTPEEWHQLRKGINPRTREEQLLDLLRYRGISHYEGSHNRTALPCPGELLVEEHHSNYGEPWAGGRDVFEFLANAVHLEHRHQVLEVGCGTLRVGLHFIRYLLPGHYHCVERDTLSLMAAFRYELPSQGLLYKRPLIVRDEDMNFDTLGHDTRYDLIFASAVFLHVPDALVWTGLEHLAKRLHSHGSIYVSHNIKFCTRLSPGVCEHRLAKMNLKYVDMQTHDSLLFNHYEIWHQFKQTDRIP